MRWDKIVEDFLSVRSLVTLGGFFTVYGLVWRGIEVPPIVAHIVDILLGFWFGSKVTSALMKGGNNVEKPN
jgi:hypothetical protein